MKHFSMMLVLPLLLAFLVLPLMSQDSAAISESEAVTFRDAAPSAADVTLVEVVSGLNNALYVTHAGDGSGRLFILEQAGAIWVMVDGEKLETPFIDLSNVASQDVLYRYSERGLLGLAFHPNYAENGFFYVNYTDVNGATRLARYSVSAEDANVADPNSGEVLFTLTQPFPNHNGGHIDFGPDGYLYMSIGDGGAAGDPLQAGQDLSQIYGTLIRIDVDNGDPYAIPENNPFVDDPAAVPEIWAWGLRNVWRFSFDRATGDMYLADVGQNVWEEVNFQPADSPGGENYGWNIYEASYPYTLGTPPEGMVYPIAEYRHENGHCSVTGGYVYRGEAMADVLEAAYFYGDWCTGQIWAAYRDADGAWLSEAFMQTGHQISSFGEDEAGELYLVDYAGIVLRFEAAQ